MVDSCQNMSLNLDPLEPALTAVFFTEVFLSGVDAKITFEPHRAKKEESSPD